jgi:hypothetical protein
VALILAPAPGRTCLARLRVRLGEAPPERMADAALEGLRAAIPAARSLPLLARLARREFGCSRLDYLDGRSIEAELEPCR